MTSEEQKIRLFVPSENKTKTFRIKIAPSTIPNAGQGVYAIDPIPKGARGTYRGVKRSLEKGDPYYSWIIYEWDESTGEANTSKPSYLVDAHNISQSNWTRFVNCGLKKRLNNFDVEQKFDKIYYYTLRDIKPGEEFFVDYGPDYRKVNLGMKGRY